MKYYSIENLDIELSCLGLGGEQIGGHGWGNISESELVKAVHKALDCGITLFDTAPIYGLGNSEKLLGKALGTSRKQVIIATKVGLVWRKGGVFEKFKDSTPANIENEIDASLKNLGTDYIDIYQIHWPDPNTPLEETMFTVAKLKQAGKIRCIGCCNFSTEALMEAGKYGKISTIQVPYNLMDRSVESALLPYCKDKDIKVLAYSPIARGFLSGKYNDITAFNHDDNRSRNDDIYFQREVLLKNLKILEDLSQVAEKLDKTPSQIAIRWVLENHKITASIFGAKDAFQVEENVAASKFMLTPEDIDFLNKE